MISRRPVLPLNVKFSPQQLSRKGLPEACHVFVFLLSECIWGFVYSEFCLFQVKLLHNLHLVLPSEAFLSLGSLLCLAGWLGFFGVLFVLLSVGAQ